MTCPALYLYSPSVKRFFDILGFEYDSGLIHTLSRITFEYATLHGDSKFVVGGFFGAGLVEECGSLWESLRRWNRHCFHSLLLPWLVVHRDFLRVSHSRNSFDVAGIRKP
jgi:hypothetical protein